MEIGSAGAGSLAQIAPTQTGSQQQVVQAQSQETLESPPEQQTRSSADDRVGSIIDTRV